MGGKNYLQLHLRIEGSLILWPFRTFILILAIPTALCWVAVSDQPVGVDIEKVRPVSQRSMRRLAAAETPEGFFQSWVRREARAKRSGDGVSTMMRSESPLQYGEYYYELETFPGYVAGVATRSKEKPEKVKKYSLEEMI